MKNVQRIMYGALTIKGITIFAFLVVLIAFISAALISVTFPRAAVDSIFPGYTMKPFTQAPLSQLELPDLEPYINDRQKIETPTADKDIIITYENILSLKNFDIITKSLYNIENTAYVYDDELDYDKLLSYEPGVNLYGSEPKILIFHTHASEAFADSAEGAEGDTIVGVGAELVKILDEKYGIKALHHKGIYDMVDGKSARGNSYEKMEADISGVLARNPSIEVLIDLHRDSLPDGKTLLTEINGRQTAQIMFVNGMCRLKEAGEPVPTEGLSNEYIPENLALSLSMKLLANKVYPGFTRKNYIKPYRYSLHMKPNTLLIEAGSDTNTVREAKNAMEPLADIIVRAFS